MKRSLTLRLALVAAALLSLSGCVTKELDESASRLLVHTGVHAAVMWVIGALLFSASYYLGGAIFRNDVKKRKEKRGLLKTTLTMSAAALMMYLLLAGASEYVVLEVDGRSGVLTVQRSMFGFEFERRTRPFEAIEEIHHWTGADDGHGVGLRAEGAWLFRTSTTMSRKEAEALALQLEAGLGKPVVFDHPGAWMGCGLSGGVGAP